MDRPVRGVLIGLSCIIAAFGALLYWVEYTKSARMDFIERHLGFSPDHGDGSTELLLLAGLCVSIAVVAFRVAHK